MTYLNYQEFAKQLGIEGRVSNNQLVGRCPLHQDSKPSFSLNLQHGAWTCFSSCGSGSFEKLVMKILGGTVLEAKNWIFQSAAVLPVSNPKFTPLPGEVDLDLRWLHHYNSLGLEEMAQWWFDRGLTWETAEKWGVRYDPLTAQVVIPFYKYPFEKGLIIDQMLLGTVTRNLLREPKYYNSPGLPRSQHLFGLAQRHGPVILLVEGALDNIWLQQCGFFPVAALLGLNMSDEHIRLIREFDEVCLALDNDKAGDDAAEEIAGKLIKNFGRKISQVTRLVLPDGRKDVSECTVLELEQAFENRRK